MWRRDWGLFSQIFNKSYSRTDGQFCPRATEPIWGGFSLELRRLSTVLQLDESFSSRLDPACLPRYASKYPVFWRRRARDTE
jgi:hypothetical protein